MERPKKISSPGARAVTCATNALLKTCSATASHSVRTPTLPSWRRATSLRGQGLQGGSRTVLTFRLTGLAEDLDESSMEAFDEDDEELASESGASESSDDDGDYDDADDDDADEEQLMEGETLMEL